MRGKGTRTKHLLIGMHTISGAELSILQLSTSTLAESVHSLRETTDILDEYEAVQDIIQHMALP